MTPHLAEQECKPCKGGVEPLKGEALRALEVQLEGDWRVVDEHHLECTYKFDDWAGAMAFANRISELAEAQNHHPDLHIGYGKVHIEIWTHKIGSLTESDFVFAAKVERLPR